MLAYFPECAELLLCGTAYFLSASTHVGSLFSDGNLRS